MNFAFLIRFVELLHDEYHQNWLHMKYNFMTIRGKQLFVISLPKMHSKNTRSRRANQSPIHLRNYPLTCIPTLLNYAVVDMLRNPDSQRRPKTQCRECEDWLAAFQ